ncbi:MAG: hypothetical protein H6865_00165 [Rhodospirillales bacterium]|nr:hypothetical protein [Alphaproteobacteria bacterium]MCB9986039.1 hypothetical protein [Rhodospirillales bacterium]USO07389.1 MAG: hypothetical protein H6866_08205 [Rhodospirillales bacterium]
MYYRLKAGEAFAVAVVSGIADWQISNGLDGFLQGLYQLRPETLSIAYLSGFFLMVAFKNHRRYTAIRDSQTNVSFPDEVPGTDFVMRYLKEGRRFHTSNAIGTAAAAMLVGGREVFSQYSGEIALLMGLLGTAVWSGRRALLLRAALLEAKKYQAAGAPAAQLAPPSATPKI